MSDEKQVGASAAGLEQQRSTNRLSATLPFPGRIHSVLAIAAVLAASASTLAQTGAQTGWIIETVAGNADAGDGGAATAAQLRTAWGVAADGSGNIYIADTSNHRIRKVDVSTGNISTVAGNGTVGFSGDGGAATAAQLYSPLGVAVDGSGNIYIADTNNQRIRKVDASTGNISTAAGSGAFGFGGDGGPATAAAARLRSPSGVAVDGSGNIYIADTSNHRVRKVTASTGVISTVAGDGTAGYGGDGAAATSAQLRLPSGVAVDGSGNIYIADRDNHRIRKVEASTGNISTAAGSATGGFSGDGGAATSAQLRFPRGVAVDGSSNIYIGDTASHRVRKVTASTGVISTVAGTGVLGYGGDGGAATSAQLNFTSGAAADGSGNLYIADAFNDRIRKVDASTGNISTIAGRGTTSPGGDGGAATDAQLHSPLGAAVDGAGNIYIADTNNNRIRKVDASTGNISTVAGTGVLGYSGDGGAATEAHLRLPYGVAVDGSGNLYIAGRSNNRIRKVDASTGVISTVAGSGTAGFGGDGGPATAAAARLRSPRGVAVDVSGNIYIADSLNHRIRKVDAAAGNISTVAGSGAAGYSGDGGAATEAQLNRPHDVAADGSGNLYIADRSNQRIRKVDASTGVISTVAGSGTAGFGGDGGPAAAAAARLFFPQGVTADVSGNLYIADTYNLRIRKVDAAAGNISTVAGNGTLGYSGDGGAAAEAQLYLPWDVTADGAGNLYIADTSNNRIRKMTFFLPPPEPSAPAPEPTVEPMGGVSELSFAPAPNADPGEPMSQTLTLRAEGGATDFQALPSARWIEISQADGNMAQWRGRLAEGETITLRVTVNPLGLRPGTHRGRLYIRAGGRVTATIRIVLEVPPPTGPAVSESGGVVNAARMSGLRRGGLFGPQALPTAPGSLVAVQGANFVSGEPVMAEGFPLPTNLGGARVLFNGAAAALFSVGPQRIEAQLPWLLGGEATAAGGLALVSVVVEAGGESSWPRRFWVGPYAPGVFTVSGEGQSAGQGQALAAFAGTTDLAAPLGFSAGSRPARGGDVLEIYATGLGAVEPPIADGMNSCAPDGVCLADGSNAVLRHTAARPRVWIGSWPLPADSVRFSGLAPDMAGVNLVVVELPTWLPPSDAAELRLAVGGRASQAGVTIAVE